MKSFNLGPLRFTLNTVIPWQRSFSVGLTGRIGFSIVFRLWSAPQ